MDARLTRNKIGHIGSLTNGGAVLLALLLLSGCGSYTYYHKDNVSTQQAYKDLYECKQASMRNHSAGSLMSTPGVATSGVFASGSEPNEEMTNSCMQARGYTISDTPRSALSSLCGPSNVTIGKQLRRPDGKIVKVTAAYGNSPRCSDPAIPILVDVEEVGEEESSVRAPQSEQDSAAALTNLGLQYYNGQGVPQDYVQARQCWEKAAAQGNAHAQANLGILYNNGQGVPQDYAQARQWYEKAAIQGIANAQANLGRMYANGQGGPQDYALARQWYAKAIAQGNANAQFYLGWMHVYGQGGPQDVVQGYLWLSVAAVQGNKVATQERDKVVTKMTPAQLAEAQRLAQQCQAIQFKGC